MNMYEQFKTNMAAAFAARRYVACGTFIIVYISKCDFLDNILYLKKGDDQYVDFVVCISCFGQEWPLSDGPPWPTILCLQQK